METIKTIKATKYKKWFVISNIGEIEPEAFNLLGASTKVGDDSKIGMFGSGANYATAYLLRNNIPFKVYNGLQEITFDTKIVKFGGKEFNRIFINGEKTSLTAEMGKDWKEWFVIREFISNAIDEGGYEKSYENDIKPTPGITSIYIDSESISKTLHELDIYFKFGTEPVYSTKQMKLYRNTSADRAYMYRKGILCLTIHSKGIFDYSGDFTINEYRQSDSWDTRYSICHFWVNYSNAKMIKDLIYHPQFYISCEFDFSWTYNIYNIEEWEKAIGDRFIVEADFAGFYNIENFNNDEYIQLPTDLCKHLLLKSDKIKHISNTNDKSGFMIFTLNEKETLMEKRALEFFKECGIILPDMLYATAPNASLYGTVIEKQIYIMKKAFSSTGQLVRTMYEEYVHHTTGYSDKSRRLEGWLFDKIIELESNRLAFVL